MRWACRRRWNGHSGSRRPNWSCRAPKDVAKEGFGFGLEYVLLQRAALGCKVDGGQHKIGSYTHPDAEVIAATVAGMPDSLGGIRMAIRVAELARAGLTPDWMPGVVPRCVPVETKRNQHGERATTVVVGTERVLTPRQMANSGGFGLSGHLAAASGTDRVCSARI